MRKPSKKSLTKEQLRKKADNLLQDYIKLVNKGVLCLLCGNKTMTVGHHFIYKSQSNATRYYMPNIIPLCRDCHCLIHNQPSLCDAKITLKMGQSWLDDLEEVKRQGVKTNMVWYRMNIKVIEEMIEELKIARRER